MSGFWFSIILFILFSQYSSAQPISEQYLKRGKDECYIVARGTRSKQGFISTKFNIKNDSITHVGIGVYLDGEFRIFNVNPVRTGNALFIEDIHSFFNEPDLVYAGIWRIELGRKQRRKLLSLLKSWVERKVEFDSEFLIDHRDTVLYCSEFCWRMTEELGPRFTYPLQSLDTKIIGLDGILKREKLDYVPVDYFLMFSGLEYCGSWSDKKFKF